MARRVKWQRALSTLALATTIAAAALLAIPIAGAATPARSRLARASLVSRERHLAIAKARVEAIGSNSFTVLMGTDEVTVDVHASTTFRAGGHLSTFADLSIGSEVRVLGLYDHTTGSLNALAVVTLREARFRLYGTVQAIRTNSFTLSHRGQSWTVDVSSSTRYWYHRGPFAATFTDLEASQSVEVLAQRTPTVGTVNALSVVMFVAARADFTGFITSIGTGSFTVLRGHATVTVNVATQTAYGIPGQKSASFTDLAVGDPVKVNAASTSTAGTVNAYAVTVVTTQPHLIYGEVTAVSSGSFTIIDHQKNMKIDVSAKTQYFEISNASASFADIASGDRVLLSGSRTAFTDAVDANWILIFPQV
jgi:hypothetical protein